MYQETQNFIDARNYWRSIYTKTSFQIWHGYIFIPGSMPVEQINNLFPTETKANKILLF